MQRGMTGSARACPACGQHTLALERPPHITVAGAQPYTELYRMGDLPMPVGVRCRSCGTWWPTMAALEAGEPGSAEEIEPVEGLEDPVGAEDPTERRPSRGPIVATVAVVAGGVALAVVGVLELVFIAVGGAALAARALRGRARRS
jgi:hypothetical protein